MDGCDSALDVRMCDRSQSQQNHCDVLDLMVQPVVVGRVELDTIAGDCWSCWT